MTTILGLRSNGVTYMASDSRVLNGGSTRIPTTAKKLYAAGEWTIGVAGWKALLNICEAKQNDLSSALSIWELGKLLRASVVDAGWIDDRSNGAGPAGFGDVEVIVGSASGLWSMDCAFAFSRIDDGNVWGIGSGWRFAAGAAIAMIEAGTDAAIALRRGIEIASRFDYGTDNRVETVTIGEELISNIEQCNPKDFGIDENGYLEGTTLPVLTLRTATAQSPPSEDDLAKVLGYPDAMTARAQGACPQCGWKENSHSVSCRYFKEQRQGEPQAFA